MLHFPLTKSSVCRSKSITIILTVWNYKYFIYVNSMVMPWLLCLEGIKFNNMIIIIYKIKKNIKKKKERKPRIPSAQAYQTHKLQRQVPICLSHKHHPCIHTLFQRYYWRFTCTANYRFKATNSSKWKSKKRNSNSMLFFQ